MVKIKKRKVQVVIICRCHLTKQKVLLLLLLQTNEKRGSFWQNVTGGVKKQETFRQAAIREIEEETGLSIGDLNGKLLSLNINHFFENKKKQSVHEKSFLLFFESQKLLKIRMDNKEHQHYYWAKCSKIKAQNFGYISNYEVFQKAYELIMQKLQ